MQQNNIRTENIYQISCSCSLLICNVQHTGNQHGTRCTAKTTKKQQQLDNNQNNHKFVSLVCSFGYWLLVYRGCHTMRSNATIKKNYLNRSPAPPSSTLLCPQTLFRCNTNRLDWNRLVEYIYLFRIFFFSSLDIYSSVV